MELETSQAPDILVAVLHGCRRRCYRCILPSTTAWRQFVAAHFFEVTFILRRHASVCGVWRPENGTRISQYSSDGPYRGGH